MGSLMGSSTGSLAQDDNIEIGKDSRSVKSERLAEQGGHQGEGVLSSLALLLSSSYRVEPTLSA